MGRRKGGPTGERIARFPDQDGVENDIGSGLPVQFDREFKIGDAARFLGISPQTLRDYEQAGAIAPKKSGGGTRTYDFHDLSTLESLRTWRQLGIGLQEAVDYVCRDDMHQTARNLAECKERLDIFSRRAAKSASRLQQIGDMVDQANRQGYVVRRERMEAQLVLSLVRDGEVVEDDRLGVLAARWVERSAFIFYTNAYENLGVPKSTWAGLAIYESDVVGWDPTEGAEGLVKRYEARRAVHGFGWRGPDEDVEHDLLPLMSKAPLVLWGRPHSFVAENLLTCSAFSDQHIFWSCWLMY